VALEPMIEAGDQGSTAPAPAWMRISTLVGSLRLTLFCLVWLLIAVSYVYDQGGEGAATLPLVPPLVLLSLNLLAAIVSNRAFRRQLPLLVFHLSLLAIIVLVALGRMSYLRATAEVVTGGEFTGLDRIEAGPWHMGQKDDIRFENLGFDIQYKPGLKRDQTRNRVRVADPSGVPRTEEIGDQIPLVVHGYRFYTSPNKGYAALFRWDPAQGQPQTGSVIFPGYPLGKDDQTTIWRMGQEQISVRLVIPQRVIDETRADVFKLPSEHHVTLDFSWRVAVMKPGDTLQLPTGRMHYLGLTTWMGYNVFYDWTMPWLLTACTLAVLALGWHFWAKFSARPWQTA